MKIEGEIEEKEHWDLKKILIAGSLALIILLAGGFLLYKKFQEKTAVLGTFSDKTAQELIQEKGYKVPDKIGLPSNENVKDTIQQAREELSKITPENVTSSSAQIEKIVNDLKALQNKQKEPIDVVCDMVCKK